MLYPRSISTRAVLTLTCGIAANRSSASASSPRSWTWDSTACLASASIVATYPKSIFMLSTNVNMRSTVPRVSGVKTTCARLANTIRSSLAHRAVESIWPCSRCIRPSTRTMTAQPVSVCIFCILSSCSSMRLSLILAAKSFHVLRSNTIFNWSLYHTA